jgi:hypothetical protein
MIVWKGSNGETRKKWSEGIQIIIITIAGAAATHIYWFTTTYTVYPNSPVIFLSY